ncbi:cadmium-translocating P-type ATPase [Nitratireductor sp. CAU 1489]|uniref:Cadmium-translocating P-type ATPase n=1 Tax=Nitratireductor arenosus TaxID=2682096 RepID=A0A844QBN6_9HYPH|nr:heavy metal translocating P-type ATPase [Nitratireductor arenosus]MVA97436.1 cadmium-translocating P-type ATPase [Nitratireductor arenosus]
MSCCAPGVEGAGNDGVPAGPGPEELRLASRDLGDGARQSDLSVPAIHCGGCIHTIETALGRLDGVEEARVNLSTKRVRVRWRDDTQPAIVDTLNRLGYAAHLSDDGTAGKDKTLSELVRALAVAGFAAGNIMLLSVSVWSGADGATRDLFHWLSALIAMPALFFAGGIFYRSAWQALRHGRMNMDVPIALGVSLAYGLSLYETINHGQHAYFDASVSLLFFLLIGRTLDHVMRERARVAVSGLARMAPGGATVIGADGQARFLPLDEIEPGMRLRIAAGDRVPVDGHILEGRSDVDVSLVTGEGAPQPMATGDAVRAGMVNLTGSLLVEATAAARESFLAEMVRLMEAAEGGRARYRRIADRASALYSPLVHLAALATFVGWMAATGDWHRAITIAIAVLIITCPCALGLAVPIVQVVAARRLFERGVMVKDGSAMERLAEIDTVVFDKTGTLTVGRPVVADIDRIDAATAAHVAALAAHSRHPVSRALARAFDDARNKAPAFSDIVEVPGRGIKGRSAGSLYRLGRAGWACKGADAGTSEDAGDPVLARGGTILARFGMRDRLRADAGAALAALRDDGLEIELLSGDTAANAQTVAAEVGIATVRAGVLPGDKAERLARLAADGHKALMVGDGLNDAPALAAAHVSMAPATAADIGRNAADFVFLHDSLQAVPFAIAIARRADRLVRQNFGLAIAYNVIAVPIAVAGFVTPLIAAAAMSLSSLLVIANALRLRGGKAAAASFVAPSGRAPAALPSAGGKTA